jgi:hypothetical protein
LDGRGYKAERRRSLSVDGLFGGGDHDDNDASFQIQGDIGNVRLVPEPPSLVLLLVGLAALAAVSGSLLRASRRQILIPTPK